MQSQLVASASKLAQLEDTNQDVKQALKRSEKCKVNLKQSLNEANSNADQLLKDKDELSRMNQEVQKRLEIMEAQLLRAQETRTYLEEALSKSTELRAAATTEVSTQRKKLQSTQGSLAKLTAEHTKLQATLTSSQQESGKLRLKLTSTSETLHRLEIEKEATEAAASDLRQQIETMRASIHAKEEEITNLLQLLRSVKEEKSQLQSSFTTVKKEAEASRQNSAQYYLEKEKETQELKNQREQLAEKIAATELDLRREKAKKEELASEFANAQHAIQSQEEKLQQVISLYRDSHSKYSQLVSVLQGTLELPLQAVVEEELASAVEQEENENIMKQSVSDCFTDSGTSSPSPMFTASELATSTAEPQNSFSTLLCSPSIVTPKGVKEAILKLQSSLATTQSREQSILAELKASQEQSGCLESQKANNEMKLSKAQESLTILQTAYEMTSKRKDELETAVASQAKELECQAARIQVLAEQVKQLNEELDASRLQREEKQKQLRKSSSDLAWLLLKKRELHKKLKVKCTMEQMLQDELESLKKEHQHLKLQGVTRESELQLVQQQLQATEFTLSEAQGEVCTLQSQLAELQQVADASLAAQKKQEEKIGELAKLANALESQKEELQASLAEKEQSMDTFRMNEELLEKQVEMMVSSKMESDAKKKALSKRITELEETTKTLKVERDGLVSQLGVAATQLSDTQHSLEQEGAKTAQQKVSLEKQIKQLKAHLSAEKVSRSIGDELCKGMQKEAEQMKQELWHSKAKFSLLLQQIQASQSMKNVELLHQTRDLDQVPMENKLHERL